VFRKAISFKHVRELLAYQVHLHLASLFLGRHGCSRSLGLVAC
jgi:hypothetical protein